MAAALHLASGAARPGMMPLAVIIDLGREMFGARKVTPETFARAKQMFGPHKLVDLVLLMGNYAGTAALLCAFDMQLHTGQEPLLPIPEGGEQAGQQSSRRIDPLWQSVSCSRP